MSKVSKKLLRSYIKEQNFKSSNGVLAAMKEMFADVLQEALETELNTHLGYDHYDISEKLTKLFTENAILKLKPNIEQTKENTKLNTNFLKQDDKIKANNNAVISPEITTKREAAATTEKTESPKRSLGILLSRAKQHS